jgi:hypothetical protein
MSAGCGVNAVTPDCSANARRIGKGPILDEVNPGAASSPTTRSFTTHHRVLAESDAAGLRQGDYSVLRTQQKVEHLHLMAARPVWLPSSRFGVKTCGER